MDEENVGTARMWTPAEEEMLRFFKYEHLPAHLQVISKPFGDLAVQLVNRGTPSAELMAGLRKLLEAKDCFVRAALPRT